MILRLIPDKLSITPARQQVLYVNTPIHMIHCELVAWHRLGLCDSPLSLSEVRLGLLTGCCSECCRFGNLHYGAILAEN
jgi:hypothetical protein